MILIVDLNGTKLGHYEFVLPILSAIGNKCIIKHYKLVNKKDLAKCDRVILSGTPLKDMEYSENLNYFEWIKDFDKPVLGICAGIQAIALVFGATLKKCKEIGMSKVQTIKENKLFSSNFETYFLHNYSVSIPSEFELLAKSKKGVVAIKHEKKEIYGVLFHPEVRNTEIIKKFISIQTSYFVND